MQMYADRNPQALRSVLPNLAYFRESIHQLCH